MEGLKQFKAELKNHAINFASVYHVIKDGQTRTEKEKQELIDETLDELVSFVLNHFNTWVIDSPKKVAVEEPLLVHPDDSTLSLDF